ncbi:MAG: hypothetical protein DCC64_15905 [Planctomycetota bacterium]|nr:MAG: hypothetical protein DCC64_15905 [Planctomycetota bacterium]
MRKNRKDKPESNAFKIRLRGKDGAPLSMKEVRDGLYEAVRRLLPYACSYRVKWLTAYLVAIDEDGNEVRFNAKGEWTIYPYKCAADEFDS